MSDPAAASLPAPLDAEAVAALLDRPDPLRGNGDIEDDIPLHALSPAPWNPKKPITGIYRRGLAASLGTFTLRDRLKVWPDPKHRGRFLALDGNQRLDVLREMAEDHAASLEAARRLAAELVGEGIAFDPASKDHAKRLKATFEAVRADDTFTAEVRQRASATPIPCRILADLDPADAKLFTAAYDRNHAAYDEGKLAALTDLALQAKESLGTLQASARKRIEAMTRPERPFVAPPAPPPAVAGPAPPAPPPAPPGDGAEAEPAPESAEDAAFAAEFGEAPPPPPPPVPSEPPLVAFILSVTQATHAELTQGILRSTQRLVRSTRLVEAIARFTVDHTEAELSDVAIETALLLMERRQRVNADA